jgi:hypothetical protein
MRMQVVWLGSKPDKDGNDNVGYNRNIGLGLIIGYAIGAGK